MGVYRSNKEHKETPNTPSSLGFTIEFDTSESYSSIFFKMEEDVRERKPRPQISLTLPPPSANSPTAGPNPGLRYYSGPLTPQGDPAVGFNLFQAYPNKAGEFVSKQFNSFRDFTLNTAKSGLSVGEKVSIWFYSRIWALSRKWFTHCFLFLIVAGYSLLGGMLFQAIEGNAEQQAMISIEKERNHLLLLIRGYLSELENPGLAEDEARWEGRAKAAVRQYERALLQHFKEDTHIMSKGDKPTWDFWSSVFYCGTIFTTIEEPAQAESGSLMDQCVRWAENHLDKRTKRSSDSKNKVGFFDRLFQINDFPERKNEDAFIDSLVGMMSKSDPELLLRLQERIKRFQDSHSNSKKLRESGRRGYFPERAPLIQFFNVTRISVGLPEDDERDLEELGLQTHLKSGHRLPKREDKGEEDVALSLEMEDGKVARILRSGDKLRYSLQIECTSARQESASQEEEDRDRSPADNYLRVIGKSKKVSNVYRSFKTKPPDKLSIII